MKNQVNQKTDIKIVYNQIKPEIENRISEFKKIWEKGNEKQIFAELSFCILTPQSKAKVCWRVIENMYNNNSLFNSTQEIIKNEISCVRFKNKKSDYLIRLRNNFFNNDKLNMIDKLESFNNIFEIREWLVKNIKGIGYKEASHFLRNIGKGENIAILDRHILKNLLKFKIIKNIPKSISKKRYLFIETKMKNFSKKINIPLSHLDFVFWYNETGEVFK